MFSEFSGSYYVGRLFVEPGERDRAAMARDQHELVNRQLYATGEGVERTDLPLVMKLENRHLAVHGDDGITANTLAVPEGVVEGLRLRNPPSLREVLLAKADRAAQLLEIARGEPGANAVPPADPLTRFDPTGSADDPDAGSGGPEGS